MTATVSDLVDGLLSDAKGLQRRADTLLEKIETMMPDRIATGMAAQAAIDDLAAAAGLARTSARALDAATMRGASSAPTRMSSTMPGMAKT